MYIRFLDMTLTDFKAYAGTHKIPLDLDGVTCLMGYNDSIKSLYGNGAAKSTIWDALIWCLYGRTPLGLHNPDVIPWSGKGKPKVTTRLLVDNTEYKLERSTSPNRFTCNGEDIPDIAAVFDLSFELAVNTVLLPQEKELFFSRTPGQKMQLFTEALPIEKWDARSKSASVAYSKAETEAFLLEGDLESVKGALDELTRTIEAIKGLANEWASKAQQKTRASEKETEALKVKLGRVQRELDGAVLSEDGALTELRASEAELSKLRKQMTTVATKVSTTKAEAKVLADKINEVEEDIRGLGKSTCPTCGQKVKPANLAEHRGHLEDQLDDLQQSVERLVRDRHELETMFEDVKAQIAATETNIEGFQTKADRAGDVITRLRPEAAELQAQIKAASVVKDEENPYTKQMAAMQTRLKKLKAEIADIEDDLAIARGNMGKTKFWVQGFKDIKLQLIEGVLDELEITSNSLIEEIGLQGWSVRFDIEKESKTGNIKNMINVEIQSPESKKPVRWEAYCGGEKQRLRLVGSLALSDVLLARAGIETNLEVLDEPAVYWAPEAVQDLVEYLAIRSRERDKSIFFIEHQAVESVHFARVWNVIKDRKGSRVEQ